MLYYEFNFYKQ